MKSTRLHGGSFGSSMYLSISHTARDFLRVSVSVLGGTPRPMKSTRLHVASVSQRKQLPLLRLWRTSLPLLTTLPLFRLMMTALLRFKMKALHSEDPTLTQTPIHYML